LSIKIVITRDRKRSHKQFMLMKYIPFQHKDPVELSEKLGKEIQPPRYLYHLNYTGGIHVDENYYAYLKRLNIVKEGLYGKDKGHGGVWANIYQRNPLRMWPIHIDTHFWGDQDLHWSLQYRIYIGCYDVWRIVTRRIDNKWYYDPNIIGEVEDPSKYLYTPTSVSGKALQLFHIELDMDIFNDYEAFIIGNLKPHKMINDFIRFTHMRKRIPLRE